MEIIRLVTDNEGLIVNRIVLDESTPGDWHPGAGLTLLPHTVQGAIGGTYVGGVYTPPPEPEPETEGEES